VGRLDFLQRLFGRGGSSRQDGGIYIRVKCNACGEVIQSRINPTSDLSQSDDGGYFVRKVLIGKQCYRSIEVEIQYADLRGTERDRQVRGGTSVE
jgi:hypothetical protein